MNRNHKCNICSKPFTSKMNLEKHLTLWHTGAKCPHCTFRFSNAIKLNEHIQIHLADRPFNCPFPKCNKSYKS